MNRNLNILFILFVTSLIAIVTTNNYGFDSILGNEEADTIYRDSVVNIKKYNGFNFSGRNLDDIEAKKILYAYAKSKNYYTDKDLKNSTKALKYPSVVVSFDTVLYANLNNDKYRDAVIQFGLTLAYSSGNCWQPHKALIINTEKGYKISNIDFIPETFSIDSVVSKDNHTIIFGYEYDCSDHIQTKKYKLLLK